jgi:glutathionyl-hydroquinone reductase
VVNPLMLENGWTFDDSFPEATGDTSISMNFSISCICTPTRTTPDA